MSKQKRAKKKKKMWNDNVNDYHNIMKIWVINEGTEWRVRKQQHQPNNRIKIQSNITLAHSRLLNEHPRYKTARLSIKSPILAYWLTWSMTLMFFVSFTKNFSFHYVRNKIKLIIVILKKGNKMSLLITGVTCDDVRDVSCHTPKTPFVCEKLPKLSLSCLNLIILYQRQTLSLQINVKDDLK